MNLVLSTKTLQILTNVIEKLLCLLAFTDLTPCFFTPRPPNRAYPSVTSPLPVSYVSVTVPNQYDSSTHQKTGYISFKMLTVVHKNDPFPKHFGIVEKAFLYPLKQVHFCRSLILRSQNCKRVAFGERVLETLDAFKKCLFKHYIVTL